MNNGHLVVDFSWDWLLKCILLSIPNSVFQEETINIYTFFRFCLRFFKSQPRFYFKTELKLIYWLLIFSSVVLKYTCDKAMWKKESWKPERFRMAFYGPSTHEIYTFLQIFNPWCQTFEWRIRHWLPILRNLISN